VTNGGPRDPSRRRMLAAGAVAAATAMPGAAHAAQVATPARGRFTDRVVLITGATSGIGEGAARAFAAEGARVFFCGRREALGAQVQDGIRRGGGEATFMRADVRREEDVATFVQGCVRRYGRIDIALNNAGIATNVNAALAEQPTPDFDDIMHTNAYGVFWSLKHELPVILRNEPAGAFGTRGVVINTASTSGHRGYAGISPYGASKAAVLSLTRNAALEYGPRGIRVNSFSPGGVDTPMRRKAYAAQGIAADQPLPPVPNIPRRANTVAEMADVILFLASDAGSSLQGTDLDVTGGNLTGPFFRTA